MLVLTIEFWAKILSIWLTCVPGNYTFQWTGFDVKVLLLWFNVCFSKSTTARISSTLLFYFFTFILTHLFDGHCKRFDSLELPYFAYAQTHVSVLANALRPTLLVATQTGYSVWVAAAAGRRTVLSGGYRWQPEDQDGYAQRSAIDVQNHKPSLGWTSREHSKSKKRRSVPG